MQPVGGVFTLIGAGHYAGIAARSAGPDRPCIGLLRHMRFSLKHLANPPNIFAHTHTIFVACLLGHTGIEQLLLNCNISSKTTYGVCGSM